MKNLAFAVASAALLLASCGENSKPQPQPTPHPEPALPTPAQSEPVQPAPVEAPKPVVQETPPAPSRPTYTVRAEIDTLPGIESSVIRLHHERIPTFANKDGKVGTDSQGKPGMKPMTMGFSRNPGVSYDDLKVADKVEVVFEINWDAPRPDERIVITKITKLPAETKLDFEGQRSLSDPKTEPKPEPK